jgi:hypothetical protein
MPRLHSRDLLSKWGFNDGDMPLDVFEWLEADSVDFFPAFSWDDVLLRLVREHLLPVLDQAVVVYEIAPHNPIRAETVEGVEVDCYDLEPAIALTPEYVDVPYGAVLAAVRDAITAKAGQP